VSDGDKISSTVTFIMGAGPGSIRLPALKFSERDLNPITCGRPMVSKQVAADRQ